LTPLPEAEGRTKATATPTPTQTLIRNLVTRRHHAKRAFVIAAS
jgi:hypothetical protein